MVFISKNWRPRRSVLFMPASNRRALEKAPTFGCDGLIFDLEDSVSIEDQDEARENLVELVRGHDFGEKETIIRVSAPQEPEYLKDLETAIKCSPDAILLPKVETRQMLEDLSGALRSAGAENIRIWAMIESPLALVNLKEIASFGQNLKCLVVGPNDLAKETGVAIDNDRQAMVPWLMDIIAHGRANGLALLDGVFNAFRDEKGLERECLQGAQMGFDGKTLIHPAQIEAANKAFSPDEQELSRARAIVELFSLPQNQTKNAVQLDGEMVERLHFNSARKLLDLAGKLGS
jgi:citrate lyase subunit beta/citryl-CoA lyase